MKNKNLHTILRVALLAAFFMLSSSLKASAQSTVYIITTVQWWEATPINIDGEEAFRLDGELEHLGAGLYAHSKSIKKCTFNTEGRKLISFDYSMPHPSLEDGPTLYYAGEIILNLYDGSEHFVALCPQGTGFQLKEISAKKAKKYFKNKKFEMLPEYIEPINE